MVVKRKTADAETLEKIFVLLKKKLRLYAKKLRVLTDRPGNFEVCGNREYEVTSLKTGRVTRKKNAYFAGIKRESRSVVLHFMPVYTDPDFMRGFSSALKKKLKGKTCFHFADPHDVNSEIEVLLEKGYASFKAKKLL